MYLSDQDAKRFYRIWLSLLHYVNQKKTVVRTYPDNWQQDGAVDIDDVSQIRDVLWDDVALIDQYVADNPIELSNADLAIAASWKERIVGEFYIFRYLKTGTVFLHEDKAYAVQGISNSFQETLGDYLPIYVQAVLISFEDKIIYDTLIAPYPISFGGGIKRSLNETYRRIQEREGLITSLNSVLDEGDLCKQIQKSNKKVLRAFEKDMGKSGLSAKKMLEHQETIALFASEFMLKTLSPRYLLDIEPADLEAYLNSSRKKINRVSFKRFVRFLRDTFRIEYDLAEDLLELLKN